MRQKICTSEHSEGGEGAWTRAHVDAQHGQQSGDSLSTPRPVERGRRYVPAGTSREGEGVGARNTCRHQTQLNNLGGLYIDQGRLSEAEDMYQRALRGKEKARGSEHISTLDIVNNLGSLYKSQGRLSQAEDMYQRVLGRRGRKALGLEHTSTLPTLVNNLGVSLR